MTRFLLSAGGARPDADHCAPINRHRSVAPVALGPRFASGDAHHYRVLPHFRDPWRVLEEEGAAREPQPVRRRVPHCRARCRPLVSLRPVELHEVICVSYRYLHYLT